MQIQPMRGAGHLLHGMRLLTQPGLRRFVALPLLINVVVFALLIWFAADEFQVLLQSYMPKLPEWLAWLNWLLWLVFGLGAALALFFGFSILANLIAAPFNGLLSEAVERHLTGAEPPGGDSLWKALRETPGAILDELLKLAYFALWAIPLLVLFIIPVVNLAAPFLWALFSAWMLAVEYGDYPMGNNGLKGKEIRARLRSRRWLSLGFGGTAMLATMIPVLNFLVMPAAVAGATAMWVKDLK